MRTTFNLDDTLLGEAQRLTEQGIVEIERGAHGSLPSYAQNVHQMMTDITFAFCRLGLNPHQLLPGAHPDRLAAVEAVLGDGQRASRPAVGSC